LVTEYVYGLDLIEESDGGENEEFFGVDGLGSTVVLTDGNGEVVETYEYDEFGELEDAAGELATDYLFAGEQFDEALGDYYLRQRFYDPSIGRFTRRDTYEGRLAEPITLNKFVYGNSDPVNGIDPSGLATSYTDLGDAVEREITADFLMSGFNRAEQLPIFIKTKPNKGKAARNDSIWSRIGITTQAGLNIPFSVVSAKHRKGIPDLIDFQNEQVYDITTTKKLFDRIRKLRREYLPAINNALKYTGRDPSWTPGSIYVPRTFVVPPGYNKPVVVFPAQQGVIAYEQLLDLDELFTVVAIYTVFGVAQLHQEMTARITLGKGVFA
ncbi:MAG: RHS repeat-associated core domain-containing protein, partial [Spirulina sp. SIO3F2]|nr:RHS repeat-associated core domain-containing protein [Spirulina sp. SIO3F2]